jgi:SAM-dependent methyltransferase
VNDALEADALAARARVIAGALRGRALLERIHAVPYVERDAWVDRVLGIEAPPPDVGLPRGAVPYLPCGVDEILAMVREVPLRETDELVDLGSGLGRVVILAHLLSGARARGVEIQEHLVRRARACVDALGLSGVELVHADAIETAIDGTVIFLYAPFNGDLLARALARIETAARRRAIVVCAVGLELSAGWLAPRPAASPTLAVYDAGVSRA